MKLFHSMTAVLFEDPHFLHRDQRWHKWSKDVLYFHRLHSYSWYLMQTPPKKPEKLFYLSHCYNRCQPYWGGHSMLDSGAFTQMNTSIRIDLDSFIKFCKENPFPYQYIASLDMFGDAKGTRENTEKMWEAGIEPKPFPSWHVGEPISEFYKFCDQYPFVGIGGIAAKREQETIYNALNACFIYAQKMKTKIHGFAVMDVSLVKDFPWYSIDATVCAKMAFHKRLYCGIHNGIPARVNLGTKIEEVHIDHNRAIMEKMLNSIDYINKKFNTNFDLEVLRSPKENFIRFLFNKLIYEDGLIKEGVALKNTEEKTNAEK